MDPTANSFVWYELMTTDAPAAAAFYQQVIGWKGVDAGMPDMAYTLLQVAGQSVAGLMALPADVVPGTPPCWTGYVAVADVDAAAARISAAGGAVHRAPEDIPGVGRFAVVADPQGAVLCLFKGAPGDEPPPLAPATPGSMGWHELYATDLDSAWAFYSSQFGWVKDTAIDMGPMGVYQLFATGAGSAAVGGMMKRPPEMPVSAWLYYVNVDAIDAAAARATAAGGKVINGPMEVPGGSWIVQCLDPQGAMFAMVAPGR